MCFINKKKKEYSSELATEFIELWYFIIIKIKINKY